MNELFIRFLQNTLIMTAAVFILLALSRILRKKTSPGLRCICWLIIALGFVIPTRPSLYTVPAPDTAPAFTMQQENIYNYKMLQDVYINRRVAQMSADITPDSINVQSPHIYLSETPQAPETPNRPELLPWILKTGLPLIWALGALVSLALYSAGHMRFVRKVKRRSRQVGDELTSLLEVVRFEAGLHRNLRLLVCPLVTTPVVTGFLRPTIILPDEHIETNRLRLMLLHEVLHIKRGDIWGRALSLLAMIAHWFNPAVHLMNRAMLTESELACDAAVLRCTGDEQRLQYGETILQTAKRGLQYTPALVSAFSGSGKSLKRRLTAIVKHNRPRRWVAVCCALLMLGGLMSIGLVGCNNTEEVTPTSEASVDTEPREPDLEDEGLALENEEFDEEAFWGNWEQYTATGADVTETDPTQEGELYLIMPSGSAWDLDTAVSAYKRIYPNVNVIIEKADENESFGNYDLWAYDNKLNVELMAGKGPDIIFPSKMGKSDIYKIADAGAFLDLSELMEQDEDFNPDDYIKPVLDSGIYRGKQYLIPYSYRVPVYVASLKTLDEIGFDVSNTGDYVSFLNEIARTLPNALAKSNFKSMINLGVGYQIPPLSGVKIADYETGAALPDEENLKKVLEAFKPYYYIDSDFSRSISLDDIYASHLRDGTFIFFKGTIQEFFDVTSQLKRAGGFGMFTVPGVDGKIYADTYSTVAIRSGSPNQQNAWNFIKLLLSPEIQTRNNILTQDYPVHKGSLLAEVEKWHNYFDGVVSSWRSPPGETATTKLSNAEVLAYVDLIMNVDACNVYRPYLINPLYKIYDKHMEPFFNDKRSLEDCLATLKNEMRLYLSE